MASRFQILSRIVYGFIYTFLHILVVALLLVTPGDIINQSRIRRDYAPIIIVSVAYFSATLVVLIVYFLRLFINRAVLNSIPKAWIPIDKGDVRKHVRKMIAAGLSRSAAIAFVSRPRILPEELLDDMCPMLSAAGPLMSGGRGSQLDNNEKQKRNENEKDEAEPAPKVVRFKRVETVEKEKELGINLPPCLAVWGEIEHPGWAPPNQPVLGLRGRSAGDSAGGRSADAPPALGSNLDGENLTLQYSTVVAELPNLIEAKALTLAPPDPTSPPDAPQLDPEAVALLQRPVYMGLREYIGHLAELGVIDIAGGGKEDNKDNDKRPLGEILPSFVAAYEFARFSTQMLTHRQFQQLMHDLATILRRMTPPDPSLLVDDGSDSDSDDSYSAYGKDDSYAYSEGDSRPFSGYLGHSHGSHNSADSDDDADIDDTGARSSPTTLNRSRTRSQPPQDEDEDVEESDGTSRRRPRTSRALLQPRQRPSRPRNLRQTSHSSSSGNSFAQTRNPYTVSSQPSSSSLRSGLSAPSVAASTLSARSASMASLASRASGVSRSTASDGGSVIIRLADRHEQSQGLPYVLTMPN